MVKWKYRKDFKVSENTFSKKSELPQVRKKVVEEIPASDLTVSFIPTELEEKQVEGKDITVTESTLPLQAKLLTKAAKKSVKKGRSEKRDYDSASSSGLVFNILSLVFGILGLLTSYIPMVGLLFSTAGIVFGIIGLKKGGKGKGMAIAGIITGGLGLIFSVIFTLYYILFYTY